MQGKIHPKNLINDSAVLRKQNGAFFLFSFFRHLEHGQIQQICILILAPILTKKWDLVSVIRTCLLDFRKANSRTPLE